VTAFTSQLELELLDKNVEQTGVVALDVRFLQWQRPGSEVVRPLIRYEVLEAGSPIVRGRDRNGPWQLFQGEARDLRGAEFTADLAACDKHTNLARQLLRFLDPGAVLRALEEPGDVRDEKLRIERSKEVECQVVEGRLPAFPLLQQGGDDSPVRLKVFVTQSDGRLLAIEATPFVDGKPIADRMERVNLLDLRENGGRLVPYRIEHLFRNEQGRLEPQSRVVLTTLSLRPKLTAEDFDRPK
jgi:hypothetical protein